MPAAVLSLSSYKVNQGAMDRLTRSPMGPIGRDIQRRGIRVTSRMKQNASGRPGPNIQTGTLVSSIAFLRFGTDSKGILADIGPTGHRVVKRGYNYSRVLEGIIPRGGAPPSGAYPFIARSLDAAK